MPKQAKKTDTPAEKPRRPLKAWLIGNRVTLLMLAAVVAVFVLLIRLAAAPQAEQTQYAEALVTEVVREDYENSEDGSAGTQLLAFNCQELQLQGQVEHAFSSLDPTNYAAGDTIILAVTVENGQVTSYGIAPSGAEESGEVEYERAKVL